MVILKQLNVSKSSCNKSKNDEYKSFAMKAANQMKPHAAYFEQHSRVCATIASIRQFVMK